MTSPRAALFALVWLLLAPAVRAAEVQDLDGGLSYLRLQDVRESLPEVPQALILDVRYVPDAPSVSADLTRLLERAGSVCIVLHDGNPPEALVEALRRRSPLVLTVGPSGANPPPDFDLAVDPEADRAAYAAWQEGKQLAALTGASTSKARFDEAALVRAQRGESPVPEEADETEDAAANQPVDRLLQRAVHLARGLIALQIAP